MDDSAPGSLLFSIVLVAYLLFSFCDLLLYLTHVFYSAILIPTLLVYLQSVYEPGKRHWLKVKKDYLQEGTMADSADLIVLGAYYGTGNKGNFLCRS